MSRFVLDVPSPADVGRRPAECNAGSSRSVRRGGVARGRRFGACARSSHRWTEARSPAIVWIHREARLRLERPKRSLSRSRQRGRPCDRDTGRCARGALLDGGASRRHAPRPSGGVECKARQDRQLPVPPPRRTGCVLGHPVDRPPARPLDPDGRAEHGAAAFRASGRRRYPVHDRHAAELRALRSWHRSPRSGRCLRRPGGVGRGDPGLLERLARRHQHDDDEHNPPRSVWRRRRQSAERGVRRHGAVHVHQHWIFVWSARILDGVPVLFVRRVRHPAGRLLQPVLDPHPDAGFGGNLHPHPLRPAVRLLRYGPVRARWDLLLARWSHLPLRTPRLPRRAQRVLPRIGMPGTEPLRGRLLRARWSRVHERCRVLHHALWRSRCLRAVSSRRSRLHEPLRMLQPLLQHVRSLQRVRSRRCELPRQHDVLQRVVQRVDLRLQSVGFRLCVCFPA